MATALRETEEETGLILPLASGAGADFSHLTLIARAITPTESPIRFHARFFQADAALTEGKMEATPELADLAGLDDAAFRDRFAGSPIKRIGRDRFEVVDLSQMVADLADMYGPLAEDAGDDPAGIEAAREAARQWLTRLRIPERLWHLPPATFSGGEQQRINIARNMIKPKPLLLLDEPTASLDAANTETVITMIREAVARGAALVGIFHDAQVGAAVATRRVNVGDFRGASA